MFSALFSSSISPPTKTREPTKRRRSIHTTEGEDGRAKKKEQTDLKATRRTIVIDE